MGAMRKHNARMTPKVHTSIHDEPEYVSRTGIQLGFTSEQAPKSQHSFFDIFYHRFKLYKFPRLSRTFTECCITL